MNNPLATNSKKQSHEVDAFQTPCSLATAVNHSRLHLFRKYFSCSMVLISMVDTVMRQLLLVVRLRGSAMHSDQRAGKAPRDASHDHSTIELSCIKTRSCSVFVFVIEGRSYDCSFCCRWVMRCLSDSFWHDSTKQTNHLHNENPWHCGFFIPSISRLQRVCVCVYNKRSAEISFSTSRIPHPPFSRTRAAATSRPQAGFRKGLH